MWVMVTELLDQHGRVLAQTRTGSLVGCWRGRTAPAEGEDDVELTIDRIAAWRRGRPPGQQERNVWVDDVTTNHLVGVVEAVYDDAVLCLRIEDDLVLVDDESPAGHSALGDVVTLTVEADDLLLYPTGI